MNKKTIKVFDNLDEYIKEIQNPAADLAIFKENDGTFRYCRSDGSPMECVDLCNVTTDLWDFLGL